VPSGATLLGSDRASEPISGSGTAVLSERSVAPARRNTTAAPKSKQGLLPGDVPQRAAPQPQQHSSLADALQDMFQNNDSLGDSRPVKSMVFNCLYSCCLIFF
jgi:hypothetical protein